jgi:hypothetical protein
MQRVSDIISFGMYKTNNCYIDRTNQQNLELYCLMAEQDNSGIPVAYMLLSTASSIVPEKRIKALTSFLHCIRETYQVHPRFVHTDKDMAEIKAVKATWATAKHQLCWWHVRRAIRQRLALTKMETSAYNPETANRVFGFIDKTWYPSSQPDPADNEGGCEDDDIEATERIENVNVIPPIRLRPYHLLTKSASADIEVEDSDRDSEGNSSECQEDTEIDESTDDDGDDMRDKDYTGRATKRKAKGSRRRTKKKTNKPKKNSTPLESTFCPASYREQIVAKVEKHFCSHPLIPNDHDKHAKAVYHWAVKDIYTYCVDRDLVEVWAYLWVNWYRPARWRLWARAESEEIPRLRTTMICESQ